MIKNGFINEFEDDWAVLRSFLPVDWEEKARELGALKRCRKFDGAEALLRTLLIHLADGCSLRETAVRAKQGGIAAVSDVALLKRLKAAGEWFRWMAAQLMACWAHPHIYDVLGHEMNIRIVDGSTVQEPGSIGTSWRIHYSIGFPSLNCDEVHITTPKIGESFKLFSVNNGDLFLGDRGFANRANVNHVV
ncbi:MAG: IS4/IS5 family transposase, partial [bacterium]